METGFNLENLMAIINDDHQKLLDTPLSEQGYFEIQEIPNRGTCAIRPMIFTWGLYCEIDQTGYGPYRFCYPSRLDAVIAINEWDGIGFPPGNWIKAKGVHGDFRNPKFPDKYEQMRANDE